VIGKTISHYKILSKIGEGGRGIVYKAKDIDLKRIVALKFISPHLAENTEDLESLYQEARSASQLNHPNITTIYEIGHSGKHNFIAMECIDGETLKDKNQREVLSTDEIIHVAIETLKGIKVAHENNIIHRDIKSENIMVTETGVVKVMDFGLAKNLEREDITKVSKTLGTIAYMSPEQIEGSRIDQRSDIYSLGVVLYEIVAGRLPFFGEHEAATLYSIVNESAPGIATLNQDANPNLIAIIEKAIEKNPDDRYQNTSELLNDLNELQDGTFKNRFKKPFWLSLIPKKINRTWFIGGLVTLSLIGLASIFQFIYGGKGSTNVIQSLAVLHFENIQDPEDPNRLGQILQELIIADLTEIPNLTVFSSQRLFDIQRQLGSSTRTSIDPSLATDIAKEAGAKTMLTGNVIQTGNNLILTSQLVNTNDGSIIKSHQVEGVDIYAMVDDLTSQIQFDMQLPAVEGEQIDVAVADKTSSSMNAFQYYFAGIDYFNKSHFQEAIVNFKSAIEIDTTFSRAYYKLALSQWWSQSEMDNESIENAQNSLLKILNGSWYRTTKEKLLAQGTLELTKQNFAEAEVVYQQLIDFIPDEKEAWYGIGEAYFHGSQDFDKASEAFERAVELDPGFIIAYRHIFDIYAHEKEYDSGIIRATQIIDENPENVWGYIFLGQMFIAKDEFDQAKQTFKDALEIDTDLSVIYQYLTKAFIELKQFEEGISYANVMLSDNESPEKYNLLAHMYIGNREHNKAIDILERGLSLNSDSFKMMLNLANTYLLDGNYGQAISQCRIIEQKFSAQWKLKGRHLLGSIYSEQGRYTENIQLVQEIISESNESDSTIYADHLNNWAYIAYLSGDSETANQKLDQAISMSKAPKNTYISYLIRSFVFAKNNDLAELFRLSQVVQDSLDKNSKDSFIATINHAIKFNYYFTSRDYASAIQTFEKMEDKDQITVRYYYYVGIAYYEIGEIDKVEELIVKMNDPFVPSNLRAFNYPRSYILQGLVNEANGDRVRAKQDYQNLLNLWQNGNTNALDYQIVLQRFNSL